MRNDDDAPPPTLWGYMTRLDRDTFGREYSALRTAIAFAVGITATVLGVGLAVVVVVLTGRLLGAW